MAPAGSNAAGAVIRVMPSSSKATAAVHPMGVQEEQAPRDVQRNLVALDVPRQLAVHVLLQGRAQISAWATSAQHRWKISTLSRRFLSISVRQQARPCHC